MNRILVLLSGKLRGWRYLFRSRLGNVEIAFDDQFDQLEKEIRAHLAQHATKNTQIISTPVLGGLRHRWVAANPN